MDRETQKRLVKVWDRAGPALEAQKRRELEAMTDAEVRAHVDALFRGFSPAEWGVPPKKDSGLVLQQRWFAKARRGR
jgi:hypothetical protein